MHAYHILRTAGRLGDHVDVLVGGIGGKNGALLADRIELAKDFFFDVRIFKYRFDDQVDVLDIVVAGSPIDQLKAFFHVGFRHFAFLNGDAVVLANDAQATIQCFLVELNQSDRNTDIGKTHGDTTTHGAAANDGNMLDVTNRCVFGKILDLGSFTLGKESMAHGL